MKVFKSLDQLPEFKNAVITIGSFDGVHQGHREIIKRLNTLAQKVNGESIVITFHPHPRLIVYPQDKSLQLITSIDEKVELFKHSGIDNLVIAPFTVAFSQLGADEYIEKFLVNRFSPKYVVIGYDHRFGLNRQGNIDFLRWHCEKFNFEVLEIEQQAVDAIAVSSTKIRNAINQKAIKAANELLGHPFTLTGTVVKGLQLGHTIGFPTANLAIEDPYKLIPPYGIYAAKVRYQHNVFLGMLYIGNRPSIESAKDRTIEINIFDFNEIIYGKELVVEVIDHIRDDITFSSMDQLKQQLELDRQASLKILNQIL